MKDRDRLAKRLLGEMVHMKVDRPMGYCHGDMIYPVNYGYVPGIMAGDGEEQDAYILGIDHPLDEFEGRVIGIVRRRNDREDKLVVAPDGMQLHQGEIAQAVAFQERYFDTTIDSLFRKSCGVIVSRQTEIAREFLLLFQRVSHSWSFPKGHMEAGETEMETALRELREETGLTAVLDPDRRAVVEYDIPPKTRKQVVYFSGQTEGDIRLQPKEIAFFRWVRQSELTHYLPADTLAACMELL